MQFPVRKTPWRRSTMPFFKWLHNTKGRIAERLSQVPIQAFGWIQHLDRLNNASRGSGQERVFWQLCQESKNLLPAPPSYPTPARKAPRPLQLNIHSLPADTFAVRTRPGSCIPPNTPGQNAASCTAQQKRPLKASLPKPLVETIHSLCRQIQIKVSWI